MNNTKFFVFIACLSCLLARFSFASGANYNDHIQLLSPDEKVQVDIVLRDNIYYSVAVEGVSVIKMSPLSLTVSAEIEKSNFLKTKTYSHNNVANETAVLGYMPSLKKVEHVSVDEKLYPPFGKNSVVRNHCNQVSLTFKNQFSIIFRAYNDGVAYRFKTTMNNEVEIVDERVEYRFEGYPSGYFPDEPSYETTYSLKQLYSIDKKKKLYLPLVVKINDSINALLTEADVYNYPSLLLKKSDDFENNLVSSFYNYPSVFKQGGFNNFIKEVEKTEDCIARCEGKRQYPWRVLVISRKDVDLADNQMVYKLSRPLAIENPSWVKPGKVVWDWWHGYNLQNVDFKTGINTKTFKYHIDFAAEHGFEYANIDWRWSDPHDLFLINPDVDIHYLVDYAKQKGVGLFLWCLSFTLDRQLERAMDQFEEWGIAGVKVDFFDREDQLANQMYERMAKAAAEHKLLVNFHGCAKPTGLNRAYPNVLNFEAVKGQEGLKWGKDVSPEHAVTVPYIRMINGPMDYTPGALRNASKGNFAPVSPPMSQGTRCHQLAMYVVYDAYLQMLCDMPTAYENEPGMLEFLSEVPVFWDQSKPLGGEIGKYIITARKSADNWYVGAMSNWDERQISINCSFLDDGKYVAKIYEDGTNANKIATDYNIRKIETDKNGVIDINLAQGGGAVVIFSPAN